MCERPRRAAGPRPSGAPRRETGWRSGPRGSRQPAPGPASAQPGRDAGAVRAGRRRDGGRWWPETRARPGTRGPGHRTCRLRARRSGSSPRPPAGQRAVGLQGSDLGFEQLPLKQHLAQFGFEPLGLQRLAIGGPRGEAGLTGRHEGVLPSGQGRGRGAQRPRECLQVFTPQHTQHRIALALARHAPTPAQTDPTRSWYLRLHRHPPADHVRLKGCLSEPWGAALSACTRSVQVPVHAAVLMVKSALNRMPLPLVRAGAWFCVVLIGVLSWLPASMEKRTGAPGQIEHVFAYFCTAAALTLAYPRSSRLKLMVGLIVYAAVLEAGQLYVPGRMAQVIDWAASGLGAVLGM